jgi:hypothetical protein
MGEVQVDGRQCDDLVGRVGHGASQGPVATPTRGGPQTRGGGRAQPSLVYARVAELGAGPTRSRTIALCASYATGRIR